MNNIFDTGYTNHIDADVHPNGKSIYLAINKTENRDRLNYYNVKIVEVDRVTRKVVRIIREYNQGRDTPGPMGYCTVRCLPDGALFIGLAITSTKDTSQVVAAFDIIENIIPVFTPTSTNTTNPTTQAVVDTEARDTAKQALAKTIDAINQVNICIRELKGQHDSIAALNTLLIQIQDIVNMHIDTLPTKEYVWQNIADRIATEINALNTSFPSVFESDTFKGYVKGIAQQTLLDAIKYATTNPAQSSLRALIKDVLLKG